MTCSRTCSPSSSAPVHRPRHARRPERHVISTAIAAHYDLHPTILDGSGLRQGRPLVPAGDRLPAARHPAPPIGDVLAASLPIVGETGTVQIDRRSRPPPSGPLHRQDRNAEQRHQPRRLLPQPRCTHARVRAVDRRAAELDGARARAPRWSARSPLISAAEADLARTTPNVDNRVSGGCHRAEPERAAALSGPGQRPLADRCGAARRRAGRRCARRAPQRERGPEYVVVLVSEPPSTACRGWSASIRRVALGWLEMGEPWRMCTATPRPSSSAASNDAGRQADRLGRSGPTRTRINASGFGAARTAPLLERCDRIRLRAALTSLLLERCDRIRLRAALTSLLLERCDRIRLRAALTSLLE